MHARSRLLLGLGLVALGGCVEDADPEIGDTTAPQPGPTTTISIIANEIPESLEESVRDALATYARAVDDDEAQEAATTRFRTLLQSGFDGVERNAALALCAAAEVECYVALEDGIRVGGFSDIDDPHRTFLRVQDSIVVSVSFGNPP